MNLQYKQVVVVVVVVVVVTTVLSWRGDLLAPVTRRAVLVGASGPGKATHARQVKG
jgi:hypothetical protein